jgi:hypothetical protein
MENKKINIIGINNKYQIKKLLQKNKVEKQRVVSQMWNIPEEYYQFSTQLHTLQVINENLTKNLEIKDILLIFIKEIERKIYGYKQQDILKNILNLENMINKSFLVEKLLECEIKCYYCKVEMLILYKNVREPNQWTVDRINNNFGHNKDNIVLSCLKCNLKRRNKNKDSYLFTKQLIIKRENFNENNDVNNIS